MAHWRQCPVKRCPHPLLLPEWWLGMSPGGRGIPLAGGRETALEVAARFVASYKGYPPLPADVAHFVRELVMDALVAAPQPVTHAWVRHSLGLAGNFARWCADQGMPLDRDVLLTRPVINRWVHVGLVSKAAGTQATYRSRLEILADCVATTPWDRAGRYALVKSEPSLPLTAQEQADAWLWAANLGNLRLRHRMMAFLALGLGCGLTMSEEGALRREDVTRDLAGVHVTVQHGRNHEVRTVTCRRDWEVRLWEVVKATPDGCLVPRGIVKSCGSACLRRRSVGCPIGRAVRPVCRW